MARPLFILLPVSSIGKGKRDDVISPLVVELRIAARGHHDVLLAINGVGRRRRIDTGTSLETPQLRAGLL